MTERKKFIEVDGALVDVFSIEAVTPINNYGNTHRDYKFIIVLSSGETVHVARFGDTDEYRELKKIRTDLFESIRLMGL